MTTRNREQTLAFRYLPFASAFLFLTFGVWRFCVAFDHCVFFVSFLAFWSQAANRTVSGLKAT